MCPRNPACHRPPPDIPFFGESAQALLESLELPGVPFETLLKVA